MASDLERTFETLWQQLAPDAPAYEREYRFAPPRKFRFDAAWPDARVAVELEGGVYSGGRHTRGAGFTSDAVKYNLAVEHGWSVLRFTPAMLNIDPRGCVEQVRKVLRARCALADAGRQAR